MSEDTEHRMHKGLLVSETDGEWMQYWPKLEVAWMRPYVEGEDVTDISVDGVDKLAGSPRKGDMIARDINDHSIQWLVAEKYFKDHYEAI